MKKDNRIFLFIVLLLLSKYHAVSDEKSIEVTLKQFHINEMVLIQGGSFEMGSPIYELDRNEEEFRHKVILESFYIAKNEVTQDLWEAVMNYNNSRFKGSRLPAENLSWYEAVEFCNRLSKFAGFKPYYIISRNKKDPANLNENDNLKILVEIDTTADGYRLPTEAEWEYACRGGTGSPTYYGMRITSGNANFNGNYPYNSIPIIPDYHNSTVKAGSYKPNSYGLFDMHGNVNEWCWDWYESTYYIVSPDENPPGYSSGMFRVVRGGSWQDRGLLLRSSARQHSSPHKKSDTIGFRIVRSFISKDN